MLCEQAKRVRCAVCCVCVETTVARLEDEPLGGGTDKDPAGRETLTSLSSVQSLYVVELKLSLRTCLARQTHARRMLDP